MDFRSVQDAAVDVAVVQLSAQFPDCQVFLFGPKGERFWAKESVARAELEWLERAITSLEQHEANHPRPFVVAPLGQPFTAMALDAEGTLYAVVLTQRRSPSAEARVTSRERSRALEAPAWLKVRR